MKSVNIGVNQYCGPAVLSILTGKTTDECADALSFVCGRADIREISLVELQACLARMRYEYKSIALDCSLYSLMHQISKEPGFYIVSVPRHVIALEVDSNHRVLLCDNHTKEPINGAASARLGQHVNQAFKVTPKPEPILLISELKVEIQRTNLSGIYVSVVKEDTYNVAEENKRRTIGSFNAKDDTEIREVMLKLNEALKQ